MLDLVSTTQFRKDLKRIRKRGYRLASLDDVLQMLLREEPLPAKHRDHDLTGDYTGFREYSGTLVKTKIAKFLNVSGNSLCGIE